uniref:Uncharacterized protein n=1 Tax=Acrobeloides nanus TaxID=290746 RepID=A0A914CFI6_9BILA
MNSSTDSSGAMKAAKTADQQSRAEQKVIFSILKPGGVKKAFVYIRMNSSTGSNGPSGSNENGQNRRSTSRAEQKAIFFRFVLFFCGFFRLFLFFFRFFILV